MVDWRSLCCGDPSMEALSGWLGVKISHLIVKKVSFGLGWVMGNSCDQYKCHKIYWFLIIARILIN